MESSGQLVCIGECMVEMVPALEDTYRMGFAGDTFNTAWYARRLLGPDWSVSFASCVGTDPVSDGMLSFMQGADIETDTVRRLEDRTVGLYMIQLNKGERSFSYWRGQSAARALADDPSWLDHIFAKASVLLYSGITLAILEETKRSAFCNALERARSRGVLTVFDSNMRPQLWRSPEAMREGIREGAASADIVFPSFDEEQSAFRDKSPEDVARRYHDAGARLVVVKNGADQVLVSEKTGLSFFFSPKPVAEVIDSTAAGDSFNAGFLAAYLQGRGLEESVATGAQLAAKVVQSRGALVELD